MFLDDVRALNEIIGEEEILAREWTVARSSDDAITQVFLFGMPELISFDHDLGGEDTSMQFLKWLTEEWLDGKFGDCSIPDYQIHSANPVGSANIKSWMETWKKSQQG